MKNRKTSNAYDATGNGARHGWAKKFKMAPAILLALAIGAPKSLDAQQTCDEQANYGYFDLNYGLDGNFQHILVNDEQWLVDMNVHGTIIIPSGKTLTIDGATIHFGDSRQMDYRTTIRVMAGGHLIIQNNAVLTSIAGCPDSMWDGIMVLGVPSASEASGLQGTLDMRDFAKIENAVVGVVNGYTFNPLQWAGDPNTNNGGIIRCENAWFENNAWSVVLRPYDPPANNGETQTHFFRCSFLTGRPINWCPQTNDTPPQDLPCDMAPNIMLYANGVGHLRIGGCTFANDYGPYHYFDDVTLWGSGLIAYNTSVSLLSLCDGVYPPNGPEPCDPQHRTDNIFRGHWRAASIVPLSPNKYAEVVRCRFAGNINGYQSQGVAHSTVIGNLVTVPFDPSGQFTPRGMAFPNSTGFEVQENEVQGPVDNDFSQPQVGMWFSNTGDAANMYYHNQFYGKLTVANIIQGDNDGPGPGDGLQFKCNNYGVNDLPNQYDIAFTGSPVSVGDKQGSGQDASTAAGNTFSPTCALPDATHMWVEEGAINTFKYWYHDPSSTTEKVYPECRPLDVLPELWFTNTYFNYNDPNVCTSQTDLFTGGGGGVVVLEAEANYALLKQVYDDQKDNGDTEGLKDYIDDASHSSYDVRNQLMLCAPNVSSAVWEQVFGRDPAMNPWHLAQALLANTPLQPEVIRMMEDSGLDPYYQQLVRGAQGSGISQLTIMESEMGHWMNRRERALNAMAMAGLKTGTPVALHDALDWDEDHPQNGLPLNRLGLLMASGDLAGAKDIVDDLLLDPEPDAGMEVLGMYLGLKIAGLGIQDVSTSDHARLQVIAATYGPGQGQAQGWLEAMGEGPFRDEMILPHEQRSLSGHAAAVASPVELLAAYPNPSDGKQPVFVVVRLPEGMEQATLRVVDPTGRLVREETITRSAAIIELMPAELPNGLFAASLSAGEVQLGTAKFTIAR